MFLYAVERGADGVMKMAPPTSAHLPTLRDLFDRRMFLLGITEQWKIDRLWAEHRARAEAAAAAERYQPGNQHGGDD